MLWESIAYFSTCHLTLSSKVKKMRAMRNELFVSNTVRTDRVVRRY